MQRRQIKSYLENAFAKLTQDATEIYNPNMCTATPNRELAPPTYVAPTDNQSRASRLTSDQDAAIEKDKAVHFQTTSDHQVSPAAFMDRIEKREMEIESGNRRYDESSRVKRNYITSDIRPWDGR